MNTEDKSHSSNAVKFLKKVMSEEFYMFGLIENADSKDPLYGFYSKSKNSVDDNDFNENTLQNDIKSYYVSEHIDTKDFVLFLNNFNKKQPKDYKVGFCFDNGSIVIGRKKQSSELLSLMGIIIKQFSEQGILKKVNNTPKTANKIKVD